MTLATLSTSIYLFRMTYFVVRQQRWDSGKESVTIITFGLCYNLVNFQQMLGQLPRIVKLCIIAFLATPFRFIVHHFDVVIQPVSRGVRFATLRTLIVSTLGVNILDMRE